MRREKGEIYKSGGNKGKTAPLSVITDMGAAANAPAAPPEWVAPPPGKWVVWIQGDSETRKEEIDILTPTGVEALFLTSLEEWA